MNVQSVALVLSGIVFGCAAGANIAPTSADSSAGSSASGEWRCFKISLLPKVDRAEGLAEGVGYAAALNQVAKSAAPGTLFQMSKDTDSENFMCVKE